MFLNVAQIALLILAGRNYWQGDVETATYIMLVAIFNEIWIKRIKEQ